MRFIAATLFILGFSSSAFAVEPFSLQQMNGENVGAMWNSEEHPNSVLVYEFYFNTCPYCNDNAPIIDRLTTDFGAEPRVAVLDIGRDCRTSDYRSWINRHNPNHPVLNDCSQTLGRRHGISLYPTTVIVDCTGKVLFRNEGVLSGSKYTRATEAIQTGLMTTCE